MRVIYSTNCDQYKAVQTPIQIPGFLHALSGRKSNICRKGDSRMGRNKAFLTLSCKKMKGGEISEISYGGTVYLLYSHFAQSETAPSLAQACFDIAAYNMQHLEFTPGTDKID